MNSFFSECAGKKSPFMSHFDRLVILGLTVFYLAFTLINLGTLSFPQNKWSATTGDSATIILEEDVPIMSIWINGNIGLGTVEFSDNAGNSFIYDQVYGEMFSWREKPVHFSGSTLSVKCTAGTPSINEIALIGPSGAIDVLKLDGGTALMDEQNTIPKSISYLNGMIFDEIYHARTAYEFLNTENVYEWTHPPLGKIIIALGIILFGMTPFGWRFMPAVFGAAMLPIIYIFSKRLFRRSDYSFLAAALFSLDTMHFTQTRIATVDVFIVFFVLLMYFFMNEFVRKDYLNAELKEQFIPLGLSGVFFGLGVAAKWTGLYAGVGLAVIFFSHVFSAGFEIRHDKSQLTFYYCRLFKTFLFCILFFIVLPLCIYYLSYIPFYRYNAKANPTYGFSDTFSTIIQQQKSMYSYHSGLTATHTCQSYWYQWPFTAKSVWFYFKNFGTEVSNISSFGNPAVWWISAIFTMCLLVDLLFYNFKGAGKHDRYTIHFLFIAIIANYLPWIAVTRCVFQYHFFPTVPFLLLAAVFWFYNAEEKGHIRPAGKWCWLALAMIFFVLLYPAASGIPIPRVWARFLEYAVPGGVLFYGAV